jgi:selenide,water dikinase
MLLSNREAARILHKYRCSACTDVTGFGLMGHLLEMLKYGETTSDSSACSTNRCSALPSRGRVVAKLRLDAVPVLDGAVECVSAGIVSSLQPANIRSARAIGNPEDGENHRSYQLLFDPQTSGGLLAAVPREAATTVIDELRQVGFIQSAVIGAVIAASTLAEQQVRLVASSGDPVHILFES